MSYTFRRNKASFYYTSVCENRESLRRSIKVVSALNLLQAFLCARDANSCLPSRAS